MLLQERLTQLAVGLGSSQGRVHHAVVLHVVCIGCVVVGWLYSNLLVGSLVGWRYKGRVE